MNGFFKIKQLVFFFICCGLCVLAILVRYAKLSMQPVTPISQNKPVVERGSIVDRSGFPLAVQTNFYHVGVSVKNIRDNEKLKEKNIRVETGIFGADMKVEIYNDGPVTIMLDSKELIKK